MSPKEALQPQTLHSECLIMASVLRRKIRELIALRHGDTANGVLSNATRRCLMIQEHHVDGLQQTAACLQSACQRLDSLLAKPAEGTVKLTICTDCQHSDKLPAGYACRAPGLQPPAKLDFITGAMGRDPVWCSDVNKVGNCPHYREREAR
jgi:hypothetical protein